MKGKILKISANDLYGNTDEREVAVFAVFNHKKYMNKYIIFAFKNEYQNKKLCYGSVHLKETSLVTFNIVNNNTQYIETFLEMYLNNSLDEKEYEILDISNIEKIELVSYGEMECDKLAELDKISIAKVQKKDETAKKKPIFLIFLIITMILLLVGVTYLYFNPDMFDKEYKTLICRTSGYNKKIALSYESERTVKFDEFDKLKEISVIDTYKFTSRNVYEEFKNSNRQNEYFDIEGAYKYDDDKLELKIIYNDTLIITEYDEIKDYLKNEGYICAEETHYE